MATYKKFEDLPVWQHSRRLASSIYSLTQNGKFAKDFGLSSQIQRAAVSIVSNIAEGFERGTDKAFCNFLSISKASAGEVRAQLYIALDLGYTTEDEHQRYNKELVELSSQIAGMMRYLKRNDN